MSDMSYAGLYHAGIVGSLAGLGGLVFFNLEPYDAFIIAVLAAGAKMVVDYLCKIWFMNTPANSQSNFPGPAQNMPHGISNTGLYSSVIPGT